jgi:hypothetical protein
VNSWVRRKRQQGNREPDSALLPRRKAARGYVTSRASERRWTVCGDPTVSQDYMFTQCDALLNNCSYEFSLNIQVSQPPSKSTSLNTYGSHNDRVRNPSPDITLTAFSGPVSKALARTNHSTRIRVCLPRAVASGLQNAIDDM